MPLLTWNCAYGCLTRAVEMLTDALTDLELYDQRSPDGSCSERTADGDVTAAVGQRQTQVGCPGGVRGRQQLPPL